MSEPGNNAWSGAAVAFLAYAFMAMVGMAVQLQGGNFRSAAFLLVLILFFLAVAIVAAIKETK